MLLMRDLDRREEQLRQADKLSALGRLAAGIAHEINNPLGSILGFAQAASAKIKPSDALVPALRGIEEEALRCRTLVQSLLTFSRQNKDAFGNFDLAHAVEGTLSMIEAQARVQGVVIARELKDGLLAAGDRGQIQQVVMNLCTNAVDAMPQGGRLTVRSGAMKGGRVFFEVEDEGTGIAEDIRNKIFDPFFTTKEVGKGTGLGLSLVHEILVRHRGTIEASFPHVRGSLFRVTLSAAAPPPGEMI
jgi:signal transduction histidine kinase